MKSTNRVKQRLCLDQVAGAKAVREPAVDGCEQVVRALPFAATRPQPREARGGAEFEGLCLLLTRDIERTAETDLDLFRESCGRSQQGVRLEPDGARHQPRGLQIEWPA